MNFKKSIATFLSALFIFSCSATQKPSGANKIKINGSWTLQNIDYSNTKDQFKTSLFGEADSECFVGSQWNFIQNNNSGTYTLVSNQNCSGVSRQIKWDIINQGEVQFFQFKRLEPEVKAKNITAGYRLQIASSTENSIQMIQNANVNGELINLIYTFSKNTNN
jgi:hypothetical protein